MIDQISLVVALLGAAAVFGTDVFFCVVGRPALRRVSDVALVETMGRLHEVADRRMPMFGALSAVAAQIIWDRRLPNRRGAGERSAHPSRAGGLCSDRRARALQARWDSVIVARVLLIGFAVVALAAALVRSAPPTFKA